MSPGGPSKPKGGRQGTGPSLRGHGHQQPRKRPSPPWYQEGAAVLAGLEDGKSTLKALVHSRLVAAENKKKIFALVCQYLKYRAVIERIIAKVIPKASVPAAPKERFVMSLMVYDLLFGRGIQCGGPLKALLQGHKPQLKAELASVKAKSQAESNEDLLPEHIRNPVVIPRFVRVNTLRLSPEAAIAKFQAQGFRFSGPEDHVGKDIPAEGEFWQDAHVEEILLFAPNTDFHLNELYLAGDMVLQDKASCFPAVVLSPPRDAVVIDACAAPGNKTSHLSARMGNTGKIFAFDISARRLDLLKKLTGKVGARNIEAVNSSFLDVEPTDPKYQDVEYVLLDPSCSGSGIVGRFDELVDQMNPKAQNGGDEEERLSSLAEFQLAALQHAFSFPKLKRVVYSTCSIHREENEDVVMAVLKSNPNFELTEALPSWPRRGLPLLPGSNYLIRTVPKEDHLIGFFVACFQRKGLSAERNQKKRKHEPEPEPEPEEDRDEEEDDQEQEGGEEEEDGDDQEEGATTSGVVKKDKRKRKKKNKSKNKNKKKKKSKAQLTGQQGPSVS